MSDKSLRFLLLGEDQSASSAIHGVGATADAVSHRMGSVFTKAGALIGGEVGDLATSVGDAFTKMGDDHRRFGEQLMAGGGMAAGIGYALSFIGSADKQASDQLRQAVESSGHSYDDYEAQIEGAVKSQENFGHSAVDTKSALQLLTESTGDPAKALQYLGLVSNLAAAKHMSLGDAAKEVARVLGGRGSRVLSEFGIKMDKQVGNTSAQAADALGKLAAKLDGQASASVDNFGGKVDIIKAKIGDWVGEVGQVAGPALQVLGGAIFGVGAIMESGLLPAIGGAIASSAQFALRMVATAGTALVSFGSMIAEAVVWGAGMAAAGFTAMLPFLPIILGLAAIAAAGYLLYKHWDEVWGFIKAAGAAAWGFIDDHVVQPLITGFDWIKNAIGTAVGFVKDHWQLMLGILTGPIGLAVTFIATHWDSVVGIFSRVVGGIRHAIGAVFGYLTAPFRMAFDQIASMWNRSIGRFSFSIPSWVPVIGGDSFSFPSMPYLASGGDITRGGLVRVGENGPEILSLPAGASVTPLSKAGGAEIHLHVHPQGLMVGTTMDLARQLATLIQTAGLNGLVVTGP